MKVLFPVIGQLLVEVGVLLLLDVLGLSHPKGLVLVHLLELGGHFLDLLLLLLVLLLLDFSLVLLLVLIVLLVIRDLLFSGLLNLQLNGESNELRVLLDQVLQSSLLQELKVIRLQVADHHSSSGQLDRVVAVVGDCEGTTCSGLPPSLGLSIHGLGDDCQLLRNQVSRVEPDTELSDHGDIGSRGKGLHERLSA